MELLIIAALMVLGMSLLLFEIFFVPGSLKFGILGVLMLIGGLSYTFIIGGWLSALILGVFSSLTGGTLIYLGLNSKTWEPLSHHGKLEGKFNEEIISEVSVGMKGIVESDLRPLGKAIIGDKSYTVQSEMSYITKGEAVVISRIEGADIMVRKVS